MDQKPQQKKVQDMGGLFIPAHIFTPHKSLYGKGVKSSLTEVFDPSMIDAVELGLSCDTAVSQLNPSSTASIIDGSKTSVKLDLTPFPYKLLCGVKIWAGINKPPISCTFFC